MQRIYADHHATTPLDPEVFEAMRPWLTGLAANASSIHSFGREARRAVEDARAEVAASIGAAPSEIVFTSGGTEADNLAVTGGARAAREASPSRTGVAITTVEHPAVRSAADRLVAEGFRVVELAVDGFGLPAIDAPLPDGLALVSAILANNETGSVNSGLAALSRRARAAGAIVHTDAVQAVGKFPVDVRALEVDLLSLTAHKFGGPKGGGALYVRKGVRVEPILRGGGQEKGRRGGTENVPAIVGLGAAIRLATGRVAAEGARLAVLRDELERRLLARCPGAIVNTAPDRLPTATSITFPGVEADVLLMALDLEGIAASSGSACTSGTTAPSRVLLAMGFPPSHARSTLRFSFGRTTTEGEIERLSEVVPTVVARVSAALGVA